MVTRSEQLDTEELYKLPSLEGSITFSDEDYKGIYEDVFKDFEPTLGDILPFGSGLIPGTAEYQINQQANAIRDQKLQNKLAYMGDILGIKINNEGFKFTDTLLKADITRSKSFNLRQRKFLEKYPDGEYKLLQIPINSKETEYQEVFRYPGETDFRMSNPYGRDLGEVGLIAGYLDPEVLAAEGIAAFATRGASLLPRAAAVGLASRTGLELKDLVEAIKGYGEDEYAEARDVRFDFFRDVVFDGDQFFEAALAGGMFGMFELGGKLITGKIRPGLIKDADALAIAAEKLGVEPLTIAQLAGNPFLRKSFFQAKEFTQRPDVVQRKQMTSLIDRLNKFGGGRELSLDELVQLNHSVKSQMENMFDIFPTGARAKNAKEFLPQLLKMYNTNADATTKKLVNTVRRQIDGANPASVNFVPIKSDVQKFLNAINKKSYVQGQDVKIKLEGGNEIFLRGKNVPVEQFIEPAALKLLNDINKFRPVINSQGKGKYGFKNSIQALVNLRKNATALADSTDPNTQAIANMVLNNVKSIMRGENDLFMGSAEAKAALRMLDTQMTNSDIVLRNNKVRQIMAGKGDVNDFVRAAFDPEGGVNSQTIKQMINSSGEISKELSDQLFSTVQRLFINDILKNPDQISTAISKWRKFDEESLQAYLGSNYRQKVADLLNIEKQYKALDNSVFKEINEKGLANADLVQEVIRKSKPGQGGAAIDNLIAQGDGAGVPFKESVRQGLIQNILSKTSTEAKEGAVGTVLNANKLVTELENLKRNENLMKFFDRPEDIEMIDNFIKYAGRLGSGTDVGGAMAGGAQRSLLQESLFAPARLVEVLTTSLRYDILAALLAKGVKSSELAQIVDVSQSGSFNVLNIAINNLAKSYGIDVDTEYVGAEFISEEELRNIRPISSMGSSDIRSSVIPSQEIRETPLQETSQLPVNLQAPVASSTLSNVNVASANRLNPNTAIAGQNVFGTDDRVFSGITNTNVGRQIVA